MNCPHCNKVIVVKLMKDSNIGQSAPAVADTDDLGELLEVAESNNPKGKNGEFVAETRKRYAQYGDKTRMSEKQMSWLRNIAYPDPAREEWS